MIRGSNRVISNQSTVASFDIHNRFDIEVIDAKTGRLKQEAKAYNVICNSLWTRLFTPAAYFSYIQYGSGYGDPSASDTSLFNYVGGQEGTSLTTSIDYVNGIFSARKQIQIAAGTAVGVTITEVGIAHGSGSSTLCTHAMLQDMNGNRVSIAKTNTDVINVYATVYIHFNPQGYDNGSVRLQLRDLNYSMFGFLSGLSSKVPNRMYFSAYDTCGIVCNGSVSDYPSDDTYTAVSISYDVTNKTITMAAGRAEANKCNLGGIRYIGLWNEYSGTYSYRNPYAIIRPGGSWFPYTQIRSEAIGTGDGSTKDFSLEFPFVSDVKVYVDGIETTDFTVDYAPNTTVDLHKYMRYLNEQSTDTNNIDLARSEYTDTYGKTAIFYNPCHDIGLATIMKNGNSTLYASNDLINWEEVSAYSKNTVSSFGIPSRYTHYKYWKTVYDGTTSYLSFPRYVSFPSSFTGKTLHFNTPPTSGAVITADYKTECIGKNSDHVFDVSVIFRLGEYTED